MSLQVWLPLTKDLRQQGLSNVTVTNNGAIFNSTGKLGGCYEFASGKRIQTTLPSTSNLNSKAISFACWVNISSWNSSYDCLMSIADGTGWQQSRATLCRNNTASTLCWNIADGNTSTRVYTTTSLSTNTWYHVACTYDGANLKIYVNGVLNNSAAATLSIGYAGTFNIGGWSGNNYPINCKMNDIRVYNHCLSPMEVKQISQGLVLHYPLNRNGWGQENLATQYVVPGSNGPLVTTTAGRTVYYGKYGITIPTTENADTYFSIYMKQALESGKKYTLSCEVNGLSNGTYYNFPLFAQNNSSMGLLKLDHNGLCSLTFTMNYTGTVATSTVDGVTLYRLFMDDITRSIASGQGAITVTNIKLEEGDKVTPWCPASIDSSYTTMGLNSTTEYDCSGFCNNGTRIGTFNWTSDTPKYSVSQVFNGTDNAIQTPNLTTMVTDKNYTIACWTYKTVIGTKNYQTIYGGPSGFELEARSSSSTSPLYRIYNWGGGTTAYNFGEWTHFCFVHTDSDSKLYVNGELKITGTSVNVPSGNYFVGAWNTSTSQNYEGNMSDFRIYATALSADDVKSLYQNSAYIDSSGNVYGAVHSEV